MEEEFETNDIVLAAVLRLNGVEMVEIDVINSKGTFIFHNLRETLVEEYNLGKVLVEPVSFNNMIKQLTTAARQMQRKQS